jgi:hypothetical protein
MYAFLAFFRRRAHPERKGAGRGMEERRPGPRKQGVERSKVALLRWYAAEP